MNIYTIVEIWRIQADLTWERSDIRFCTENCALPAKDVIPPSSQDAFARFAPPSIELNFDSTRLWIYRYVDYNDALRHYGEVKQNNGLQTR